MMENTPNNQRIAFSIRHGLSAPFMYKGHQIVVHNSSFSPRENIYVDDQLVVNRWSLSLDSTQVIEVEGDQLILTYGINKDRTGFFLKVIRGDTVVHEASHLFRQSKTSTLGLAISVFVGALVGFAAVSLLVRLF